MSRRFPGVVLACAACAATLAACFDLTGPKQMNMGERLGTLLSAPGEYVESWSPFYGGAPGTPTRAWGPDVQEILYTSSVQGPPARVQAVQPDGTHRRFLAEAGGFALSRDGSYAYYVGAPDTTTVRTLYRVPWAGGNPEPILVRDSLAGPVLSPGNRFVLYQVWREGPDARSTPRPMASPTSTTAPSAPRASASPT